MSNQLKQYINNLSLRNKSNERIRNPKSNSPISRPLSKQIQKNQPHYIINNHNEHSHQNITVNKINHQKGQIQIEGELNFHNKNPKQNNQNKGKNVGHNAFELMSHNQNPNSNTRIGNFNNIQKKKPLINRVPRKSPIPVPKNYNPNMLNYQKFKNLNVKNKVNNNNNNNSNHIHAKSVNVNNANKLLSSNNNHMNKTYNSFRQKNNVNNNRSLSPMTRTKDNTPKLSPNFLKPKFISKSPNPAGNAFNKYKNFHLGSSTSGNSITTSKKIKNNNNRNLIKKTIQNNNNIKRVNNVNTHQSKQMVISGDLTQDSTNNSKINISKSGNISLNNNQNSRKEKPKNKNSNSNKQNDNNNHMTPIISNTTINNNSISQIDKDSLTISQQMQKSVKEPMTDRSQNTQDPPAAIYNMKQDIKQELKQEKDKNEDKKEPKQNHRSNSQPQYEIIKPSEKIEQKEKNQKQNIPPKKILKKIKNIHAFTHVGFDGEQDKENNQDSYFIFQNFTGHKDYYYFSVCDGHGVEGHFVSNFIKEILPVSLSQNLRRKNILTDTEIVHEIITETFLMANEQLVENENINSTFSGSTCVSVIYTPERLICPNIGDSRAVLGRYDIEKKKYIPIELTRDHKPTEEDEARRIIENDGRIQPFIDEGEYIGPQRVWVKEDDVPGLAMTRSFGDRVAATVGVISEPEIKEWNFMNGDKFMLIASDGVWEFISSEECINFIGSFYENDDMKGCCEFLYEESKKRWLMEEDVIDDITMILVFFE